MIFRLFGRTALFMSILILGLLGSCLFIASQIDNQQITYFSLNDEFAYPGSDDETRQIYTYDNLWAMRAPLTRTGQYNSDFVFTPDGAHILYFTDDCGGQEGLCQMDRNGHNQRLLNSEAPTEASFGDGARWSQDSTRLAFITHTNDITVPAIYILNHQTGQLQVVAANIPYLDWDTPIAWAPDGHTLYIVIAQPNAFEGYRIDLEGPSIEQAHRWLQGTWNDQADVLDVFGTVFLVRSHTRTQLNYDLYALDMVSGAASNISDTPLLSEIDAAFAHGGSQIAVVIGSSSRYMLSTIALDASTWQMLVPPSNVLLFSPTWLQDDTQVLYRQGDDNGRACFVKLVDFSYECPLPWTGDISMRP